MSFYRLYPNRLPLLSLLLLVWICGGCGRSRTPAPGVPPVAVDRPPLPAPPEAPLRILLLQDFETLRVEGTDLAPLLLVYRRGETLQARAPHGARGALPQPGTGFRLEAQGEGPLLLEGRPYRGALEVFINPVGQAVAVNEVPLEEYLKGVVPNELSPAAFPHMEALKAQAVAARTFALAGRGVHARHGFDLFSDQRSQVYRGSSVEHPLSNRAVEETSGLVAVHQDVLIHALYSSTCGGRTEAFENIFKGEPIPYLAGGVECRDASSRYHTWNERLRVVDIRDRLDRYADVGDLYDLVPLRRGRSGRTVEMRFLGSLGERVLSGNDLRFALGLRSNWVEHLEVVRDGGPEVLELIVRGKGWGHGVGLCQIGAVEMARRGRSFEEILKHYYRGIEIVRRRRWLSRISHTLSQRGAPAT